MRSKIFILILLLIVQKSFSQTSIEVHSANKIIGKNYVSQSEIQANEFAFPKRIHHSYVDTITGYATLQLRKLSKNGKVLSLDGLIVVFDLNNKTVKWVKKIDYSVSSINQYSNIIIFSKGNKITRLNIEDGSPMWDIKHDLYYVDVTKRIGVGYKYNGMAGNIHTLEGINVDTGETLWEKELNREYGWNRILDLDNSDLLVVAGGLHTLNINNGSGWDYQTVTGKKDYTETVVKNVGGIALGLLTGAYVVSTGSNLVRDVVSNVIIDSTNIFMASKEQLTCLEKTSGNIIWSYTLPEKSTSKSSLIMQDSTLVLINRGYAYWRNKLIPFGESFILKINKTTGKELYFSSLNKKDRPVYDYRVKNDSLLLLFDDELVNYSLINGVKGYSKLFNKETYGEFKFFVGNQLYAKNKDSLSEYATLADSIHYFIQTSKGKTLKFDKDFNILDEFNFNDLYLFHSRIKDFVFINQDEQTVILDKNNNPVGEINIPFDFYIRKNKLYLTKENSLFEVDLSELYSEETNSNDLID